MAPTHRTKDDHFLGTEERMRERKQDHKRKRAEQAKSPPNTFLKNMINWTAGKNKESEGAGQVDNMYKDFERELQDRQSATPKRQSATPKRQRTRTITVSSAESTRGACTGKNDDTIQSPKAQGATALITTTINPESSDLTRKTLISEGLVSKVDCETYKRIRIFSQPHHASRNGFHPRPLNHNLTANPDCNAPALPAGNPYVNLLDQIIRIARCHFNPNVTATPFHETTRPDTFSDLQISGSLHHYGEIEPKSIGAAGELFVFELLSSLGLPNFGIENWLSGCRGLVNAHPAYQDLDPYDGVETADITYIDHDGTFTRYLEYCCLHVRATSESNLFAWSEQPWDEPVEYLIEVKSTKTDHGDYFRLSKAQRRMRAQCATKAGERPKQVYVVFRVYNVSSPKIDAKIFVGPWELEAVVWQAEY